MWCHINGAHQKVRSAKVRKTKVQRMKGVRASRTNERRNMHKDAVQSDSAEHTRVPLAVERQSTSVGSGRDDAERTFESRATVRAVCRAPVRTCVGRSSWIPASVCARSARCVGFRRGVVAVVRPESAKRRRRGNSDADRDQTAGRTESSLAHRRQVSFVILYACLSLGGDA